MNIRNLEIGWVLSLDDRRQQLPFTMAGNTSSFICRLVLISSLASMAFQPVSAATRTFTDQKGREIEAEIVSVAGTKVTLKLANGRTSTIPIKVLSKGDQTFVRLWQDADRIVPGGKADPVIPKNITYRLRLEVDKERTKKGTKTRVETAEVRTDEWIYEVELENRSRVNLEGLEMSYRIYVDPKASAKLTFFESPPGFYGGRVKVKPVADGRKVMVKTGPAKLKELELDGDREFRDGSRNNLEDKLEGVWIKLWHGDRKVGEFKSNSSLVKKATWADNEPADPEAEPEKEEEKEMANQPQ
jgi:hypothetical protein